MPLLTPLLCSPIVAYYSCLDVPTVRTQTRCFFCMSPWRYCWASAPVYCCLRRPLRRTRDGKIDPKPLHLDLAPSSLRHTFLWYCASYQLEAKSASDFQALELYMLPSLTLPYSLDSPLHPLISWPILLPQLRILVVLTSMVTPCVIPSNMCLPYTNTNTSPTYLAHFLLHLLPHVITNQAPMNQLLTLWLVCK